MKIDVGRYHKLPWGGGQITIPKDLVKEIELENKNKLMIEYDEEKSAGMLTTGRCTGRVKMAHSGMKQSIPRLLERYGY